MTTDYRLSHQVTVAHAGDPAQTIVREGGPRAADVLSSAVVELHRRVEAQRVVAEGGMAVVHDATAHTLGRRVAIEVLKRDATRVVRAGFQREAAAASSEQQP